MTPVNPWLVAHAQAYHPGCMTCSVDDRLDKIRKSTDITWLRQVLAYPDNQLTVRQAAERRIRVLRKAHGIQLGPFGHPRRKPKIFVRPLGSA